MSPRSPCITAVEFLRALKHAGLQPVRQSGSHVTLKHPNKPGSVTVPKHANIIIKPKTLSSILEQAGLTTNELRELL
jgi:predicted RNA binding protein YcfA (HicA-like mRNA interferase family)